MGTLDQLARLRERWLVRARSFNEAAQASADEAPHIAVAFAAASVALEIAAEELGELIEARWA